MNTREDVIQQTLKRSIVSTFTFGPGEEDFRSWAAAIDEAIIKAEQPQPIIAGPPQIGDVVDAEEGRAIVTGTVNRARYCPCFWLTGGNAGHHGSYSVIGAVGIIERPPREVGDHLIISIRNVAGEYRALAYGSGVFYIDDVGTYTASLAEIGEWRRTCIAPSQERKIRVEA